MTAEADGTPLPSGSVPSRSSGGRLRVGAPMWAHPAWIGSLFPSELDPLAAYATWCTAVEGNTTFYATPSTDTVARWAEILTDHPDFRFCFKLPKAITHDRRLRNVDDDLHAFLDAMAPVLTWTGPVQVQLPASFGPDDLEVLVAFLDGVPRTDHRWAVEVRHLDFFPGGDSERRLNDALAQRRVNRVLLDSRPLYSGHGADEAEVEALHVKPKLPVRPVATGDEPIVRLIGRSDEAATEEGWQQWLPKVVEWLEAGLSPTVFVHTPDNVASPQLNRRFHRQVQALVAAEGLSIEVLPELPEPVEADVQLDLF